MIVKNKNIHIQRSYYSIKLLSSDQLPTSSSRVREDLGVPVGFCGNIDCVDFIPGESDWKKVGTSWMDRRPVITRNHFIQPRGLHAL